MHVGTTGQDEHRLAMTRLFTLHDYETPNGICDRIFVDLVYDNLHFLILYNRLFYMYSTGIYQSYNAQFQHFQKA